MMIRFNDLRIPFHRLALGTVLIDPDDIRYLKLLAENPVGFSILTCSLKQPHRIQL